MKDAIREDPAGLEMQVAESGENFSIGQRMLLSLARAMLKKAQVVIMDEATANVDWETDALIQKAVKDADCFRGVTKLIIAHRIKTIEDSDLIVVLDAGRVAEVGTPAELLSNPSSTFAQMSRA